MTGLLLRVLLGAALLHTVATAPTKHVVGRGIAMPAGYSRILFQDDFSTQAAGSPPSPAKWAVQAGTGYANGPESWGTHEVQSYGDSRDNLRVTAAGTLLITPINKGGSWTSGRIETASGITLVCAAGAKLRIEASLRFGEAPVWQQMGIWPSFWAMGSDLRRRPNEMWPSAGEVDIAESINGVPTVWHTLHCGTAPAGPCDEFTGISSTAPFSRGDFHTVAVEIDRTNPGGDWRGETLTWYVDGAVTATVAGTRVNDEAAWTAVTRNPKFLILNVAIGGDFPDNVANDAHVHTPTPQTVGGAGASLEVNYVAVFST